jgi:hypothetical protein
VSQWVEYSAETRAEKMAAVMVDKKVNMTAERMASVTVG